MNTCIFLGSLKDDLVLKSTANFSICEFTLVVDDIDKKTKQPTKYFLNMVAFGKIADELIAKAHKDDRVIIQCTYREDHYTNSQGEERKKILFNVNNYDFVKQNPVSTQAEMEKAVDDTFKPYEHRDEAQPTSAVEDDGDLPF